ncbi:MAG TPA: hypothetical protein VH643_23370 [Gemmataceae bacterium]|jgi:hypothetical protein
MKSDTTPPISPPVAPALNVPSSAQAEESMNPPIPEEIVEDWRWIMKGREEGVFDSYAGKHVAVYQQKIWGSSLDAELLREYVALKHQIDPERLVIVYIDRW